MCRFGQLELFWRRGEFEQMAALADHALAREFSDAAPSGAPASDRYRALFRAIVEKVCQAHPPPLARPPH